MLFCALQFVGEDTRRFIISEYEPPAVPDFEFPQNAPLPPIHVRTGGEHGVIVETSPGMFRWHRHGYDCCCEACRNCEPTFSFDRLWFAAAFVLSALCVVRLILFIVRG